jgi:membrane dipeptidase
MKTDYERIHQEAILIDGTCPLISNGNAFEMWLAGGATAACATVGYGQPDLGTVDTSTKIIHDWLDKIETNPAKLVLVHDTADICLAKAQGKLGIIFHFQGSCNIGGDLKNLEMFHRLGLRMVQLCYNVKDLVGCGCTVPEDQGLTGFGREAIAEMNRLGIVVDCAHTGLRTTREAIAVSKTPVIVSHANARAICANSRNLPDSMIKEIADNGGVIGLNGFPAFVAAKQKPTLDDLLDHACYIADLVGVQALSVGVDYFEYQAGIVDDATAGIVYDYLIKSSTWAPDEYPPPPWHYPQGMELPDKLPNLTTGMLRRGFSEKEVKDILGGNLLRIFGQVWA